jgi:hypothetical protein
MDCRDAFVEANALARDPAVPPPRMDRIGSFESGHIRFAFGHNRERDGWEITTMYAERFARDESDS